MQRNVYTGHQENILLSMLGDDDKVNNKAARGHNKDQAAGVSQQQVREI